MLTQTELARFVDKARELMNDGGAHWGRQFFQKDDSWLEDAREKLLVLAGKVAGL